ncbi:50S ribosomal protein L30 [Corynebacterium mendelii]|uniref:Large ribosomal subunit protein uL30 n=1 Tax=Corynebacterium mendelii TaxID=2765362 RepID=A0A939IV94_9CORY|nr:50S ribosomal protein L30 [Corynebacterium mendelii]MBN9644001.1 50S ribosomal protein L30 [Corynebacterium mendelii]
MALKITQKKGLVGAQKKQKDAMQALGLRKIHQSVVHPDNAAVRGNLKVVAHLVTVEEVEGE